MRLRDDWRLILRRAWSVRLMVLAGVLSAAEMALPLFAGDMPRGAFAALAALTITGAMIARIVAQRGFR